MQASAESRVTRPPQARLRMQAKLAPPTVLVRKADLLNTLKAPDSRKECFGGTNPSAYRKQRQGAALT
jgi:hypothetical protein